MKKHRVNKAPRRTYRTTGRKTRSIFSTQASIEKLQPAQVDVNKSQPCARLEETNGPDAKRRSGPSIILDITLISEENPEKARSIENGQETSDVAVWLKAVEEHESPPQVVAGSQDKIENSSPIQISSNDSEIPDRSDTPSAHETRSDGETSNTTKISRNNAMLELQLRRRSADPSEETPGDIEGKLLMGDIELPYRRNISYKDVKPLIDEVGDFARKCVAAETKDEDLYEPIETFRNQLKGWLPQFRMFTATNKDFNEDLNYCKGTNANEALFKCTLATTILDLRRREQGLECTSGSQWSRLNTHRVPSTAGDTDIILSPKPDFCFSFSSNKIRNGLPKSAPIPDSLALCISPDDDGTRCFPFFFIETWKFPGSLYEARLHNMNSAMQALNNLFVCMKQANDLLAFFDTVRVFSISLNLEKYEARIYRAITDDHTKELEFAFQTLREEFNYGQDSLSGLIDIILTKYAKPKLLPLLQTTYKTLADQSKQEPGSGLYKAGVDFKLPPGFKPSQMYKNFP